MRLMKNIIAVGVACIVSMLVLSSCHTTEENYKASYDIAAQKKRQGVDEETYNKIQQEKNSATAVVNGDSVRILNQYVGFIDVKRDETGLYSLIVAQFKQKTNARSMRDRLITEGHKSYVLFYAKEKLYYVAVEGFDNPEDAVAYMRDAENKIKMKVNLQNLWILKRLS